MFEEARSWYRNRPQQQSHRERPRTILSVEWLEKRELLAGDTYTWNPPANAPNLNASTVTNWEKNGVQEVAGGTLPGNNPNDVVRLYGGPGWNNSNITWDKSFKFSKLSLGFGYTGTETIENLSTTLDLTGAADGTAVDANGINSGYLIIQCEFITDTLQIDNNANIAAFSFKPVTVGNPNGTILIDGGITTICTGVYNKNSLINGALKIQGYSSVVDNGKTQLILDGKNTKIVVGTNALMQVYGGTGQTLISEGTAGNNDYIDVQNGGYLSYIGTGVTDTFTVPVWVEQGGYLKLSGGGTLYINAAEYGTNNVSLYLEGNFQSKNGTNLKPGKGMIGTSTSNVATLDSNTVTITVASGNPCELDGEVTIDTDIGTYGNLVVNCDTLDLGGTLQVHMSPDGGTCDELIVNGILNLNSNTSMLDPVLDGTPTTQPLSWLVIHASGGIEGQFSYIYPVNGVYYNGYNYPYDGDFTLYYGE